MHISDVQMYAIHGPEQPRVGTDTSLLLIVYNYAEYFDCWNPERSWKPRDCSVPAA